MFQIFSKIKLIDVSLATGALLGGLGLALWSNPQWYYNAGEEYANTGVMLTNFKGVDYKKVSSELNSNFFTYHDISGCSLFRKYCLLNEAIKIRDDVAKELTQAAFEIHSMCLEVVERVVKDDVLMELFEIPEQQRELCKKSWEKRQTDCMGRLDFIYDGHNCPKLLEYNADTPTMLIESGIGQNIIKKYLEKSLGNNLNSFNFLENSIKYFWKVFFKKNPHIKNFCVTTDCNNQEELQTIKYMNHLLQSSATEEKNSITLENQDIANLNFFSTNGFLNYGNDFQKIDLLWKLYPYEWLNYEDLGRYFEYLNEFLDKNSYEDIQSLIIEPYWKLILSSKALLPFLWEMYPNHPNLLPAYFESPKLLKNDQANLDLKTNKFWVAKTLFGREGNGVEILERSDISSLKTEINLEDGFIMKVGSPIYQAFLYSMRIQRMYPTFGVWVTNGLPSSIGIRLCNEQIAKTNTSFVSHYLDWNDKFLFKCTQRQKDLRYSLYGDDIDNAISTYGSDLYPSKIDFGLIDSNSLYYKKYHSKTEINECHCGGGCPSYRKAQSSLMNRSPNDSTHNKVSQRGRKFQKINLRKSTGFTSKSYSVKS